MLKTRLILGGLLAAASFQLAPLAASASDGAAAITTRSCAVAHANAAVVSAVQPGVSAIARETGATGTALVRLELTPSGAIAKTSIYRSTGNPMLDSAALVATRWSSFRPEVRNCEPVGGAYLYTVNFE